MDMQKKALKLAGMLKRKNKRMSWREMSRSLFDGVVNHATLCRIATTNGEYIPRNEDLQIALGLKRPSKPAPKKQTSLHDMSADALRKAIMQREEMPMPDPRILNAFVKAGLLEKKWIRRS